MALAPFIFGGNTGIKTPQEAAHLRAVAEALASQGRTPHTIGEGLSAIGDAIASRRYRMRGDRMESEGRAAYQAKYGDLLKTLLSGGGGTAAPVPTADAPGGEVPPQPDLSQAHPPTMENVANTQLPPPEDLNAIVRTVIGEAGNQSPEGQRAVAEVILNRARESGMTPQQVVSAKGQFEPWSTRAGELNAIDPNSQAYQSVLGNITSAFGPDDPTGGADHFYAPKAQAALGRDAPDWAQGQQGTDIGDQRFYKLGYGGHTGTSSAQDAVAAEASGQPVQTAGLSITGSDLPQSEPQQPGIQQVADSGGFDPRMIDALNDPWAPEGTKAVLGALLEQRLKEMHPPPADPFTLSEGQVRYGPTGQEIARGPNKEPDLPGGVREYQFAVSQGFPGTFQDWEASKKGGMSLQVDPTTGAVSFQQGGNIKPLTEGQSKDTVYATRATGALPLLDKYGAALTNLGETVGGGVPLVGNYMKSPEYQQAEQAGREFLTALLRKDTGATIQPFEIAEYAGTYLPQPGDKPPVLEQKRISRLRALEGIKAGMPPQAILAMEKAGEKVGQSAPAPSEGGLPEGSPKPGDIEDGYRFKGGDPADRNSWEPVS